MRRKTAYIYYSNRSCLTGRKLFKSLKNKNAGGYNWRRCFKNNPKRDHELGLLWGTSKTKSDVDFINSNSINASDKMGMMVKIQGGDVNQPNWISISEIDSKKIIKDSGNQLTIKNPFNSKKVFVRDRNNNTYCVNSNKSKISFNKTDLYISEDVGKQIELRIHIFNDKCIGVYEKIPNEEGVDMYKNHNCDFRRLDRSNENVLSRIKGAIPEAKNALNSLEMVFGGVDVVKGFDNKWYVLEVNSAPALNDPNIERWTNAFDGYIKNMGTNEN